MARQETRVRVKGIERTQRIAEKRNTRSVDEEIAEARPKIAALRRASTQLNAVRDQEIEYAA